MNTCSTPMSMKQLKWSSKRKLYIDCWTWLFYLLLSNLVHRREFFSDLCNILPFSLVLCANLVHSIPAFLTTWCTPCLLLSCIIFFFLSHFGFQWEQTLLFFSFQIISWIFNKLNNLEDQVRIQHPGLKTFLCVRPFACYDTDQGSQTAFNGGL